MTRRRPVRPELLQERLDALVTTFDVSTIAPDPLQLVLRYEDPLDQETVGLIAASFAYGRAETIVANIGAVLAKMAPSPHRYLASFDAREATRRFTGFAHRFHKAPDLIAFLQCIANVIESHGSLGALFRECYDKTASDIAPALTRFTSAVLGIATHQPATVRYLLTSPTDGSACKRMNLYLRWMVRTTSPDLGLWTFVDPAKLVIPLDTHVHRIATFLGLSNSKSGDW